MTKPTEHDLEARREQLRLRRQKLHVKAAKIRKDRRDLRGRVRDLTQRIKHYVGALPGTFFDSVNAPGIPAAAKAFAGYVAGAWPTYAVFRKAHPKSKVIAICQQANQDVPHDADVGILDCETFDASPKDFPGWYKRQRSNGYKGPLGPYASKSEMVLVLAAIKQAGIPYSELVFWVADPTGKLHRVRSGDYPGLDVDSDATQCIWAQNYDESVARRRFWTG